MKDPGKSGNDKRKERGKEHVRYQICTRESGNSKAEY